MCWEQLQSLQAADISISGPVAVYEGRPNVPVLKQNRDRQWAATTEFSFRNRSTTRKGIVDKNLSR